MKISIQQSENRDIVGIYNALSSRGHKIVWWDCEQNLDIKPDVAIFNNCEKLGYRVMGATAKAVNIFIDCQPPEICKAEQKFVLENLPALADTLLFPPAFFHKNLAVDAFYLSIYPLEKESETQTLNMIDPISNNFTYRIAGTIPTSHVSYIGSLQNPEDNSKLCKSAGVCLDFGFKQAIDLLKLGCRVITDTENNLDIPVFTPSTINQVIKDVLSKPKPIINKYEATILSYNQFCDHVSKLIGVSL